MSEVDDIIKLVKDLHPLGEGTLGTSSVMLIIDEVDELRDENARLEALFQQTHGVHHSWVWSNEKLKADLTKAEASIVEHKATERRLRAAAVAFSKLVTCYKIGRTPSEGLFKQLEAAREVLAETSPSEGDPKVKP